MGKSYTELLAFAAFAVALQAAPARAQLPVTVDCVNPYFEDFEAGPAGWTATGPLWVVATPAQTFLSGAFSGTQAWVTDPTGNYPDSADEAVSSPVFDFSGLVDDPELRLRILYATEFFYDGVRIEMDLGSGFVQLGAVGPDWYDAVLSNGGIGGEGFTGGSGIYRLITHPLTGAAGSSSVVVRVRFGSDATISGEGVAFDDVSIIAGTPTCAAGNVSVGTGGGGPYDVLFVNGSAGNCARVAAVGSDPFTIEVVKSPEMAFETVFTLWGKIGAPAIEDRVTLPLGIGAMCFPPCLADPGNPALFVVTDSLGVDTSCAGLIPSGGTPLLINVPGLPPSVPVALQALIFEPGAPLNLAVSNMIIIDTATTGP